MDPAQRPIEIDLTSHEINPPGSNSVTLHGRWLRIRRMTLRLAAVAASFLLVLTLLTASAAWYTSRSEFCNSCHIMEPYYTSWQESAHHDVGCIECHMTPGFGGKVRGKMQGLVQLTKYLTKSEGPLPAAQIVDLSCLRAGCHETRLLTGRVDFQGITFDHKPHISVDGSRGMHLRCTSCHNQPSKDEHMAVDIATCYLCHFKEQPFNEGLSACTRCHQIPEKTYDLGGGTQFTHELAFTAGVDCANCHRDVVRGDGQVAVERCRVCHNDREALARIDEREFLHAQHTRVHKVDCADCHEPMEHSRDAQRLVHAVSDCASCHPNHHEEQVRMFEGVDGKLAPDLAGGMTVSRIGCKSCHRVLDVSPTGTMLWKSSAETCSMCHEQETVNNLLAYQESLSRSLADIEAAVNRAQSWLETADLSDERRAELKGKLDLLRHDVDFLRIGKGIHNVHYADRLQQAIFEGTVALCQEVQVEPPTVVVPPELRDWKTSLELEKLPTDSSNASPPEDDRSSSSEAENPPQS